MKTINELLKWISQVEQKDPNREHMLIHLARTMRSNYPTIDVPLEASEIERE
jgi:hypothetical protein